MAYNPNIHHRRSIRLQGYNYSQAGLYFITICAQNRECLFGQINVGVSLVDTQNNNAGTQNNNADTQNNNYPEMILNDAGKMIKTEWLNIKTRFPHIELHEYIIMPNHFHGILEIVGTSLVVAQNNGNTQNDDTQSEQGQPQGVAPTGKTIGDMMDAFKSITTVEYIRGVKHLGWQPFNGKLWQRNYYEHIIRNEQSYQTISNYIMNNPAKWKGDKFYNQ